MNRSINKKTTLLVMALATIALLSGMSSIPKEDPVAVGHGRDRASTDTRNEPYGHFELTGSLNTPRVGHTATLLDDGNVLVAGGTCNGKNLSSAEIYDYKAGIFNAISSLNQARQEHVAVKLQNGKVLFCGGVRLSYSYNKELFKSVEIFDPNLKKFINVASMLLDHGNNMTATLLLDGRVFVCGGIGREGVMSSAEIYDPTRNIWERAGTMNVGRYDHSAALLPDGKVLIVGGRGQVESQELVWRAELFNPFGGKSKLLEKLKITGDQVSIVVMHDNRIFLSKARNLKTNVIFELDSNKISFSDMKYRREHPTATLLDNGNILIVAEDPRDTNEYPEIFNPSNNKYCNAPNMIVPRSDHKAVLLINGKVLIVGGANSRQYAGQAELYVYEK